MSALENAKRVYEAYQNQEEWVTKSELARALNLLWVEKVDAQFATVWHEGSRSFYHAQLLYPMSLWEVDIEARAAAGDL